MPNKNICIKQKQNDARVILVSLILISFGVNLGLHGQIRDTTNSLRYPLENKFAYPYSNSNNTSPLLMPPPSNVKQVVVYEPETNTYMFNEKIGDINIRPATSMSFEEYNKYQSKTSKTNYWKTKSKEESGSGPSFLKGLRLGNQSIDKVFGGEGISITPQGSAELIFGYSITNNKNPSIPVNNQRNGSFIFKEKIMMNVTGSIGDKFEIGLNYNTEATFDFENKTKLEYTGKEDEIIKKIEAGDVSFSVPGTLITGSQSLFGLKTELQFGKMNVSTILSHQKSESSSINVKGGAQQNEFEIEAGDYDINRHFFLSHFFRDNYDDWLKNLPNIESNLNIIDIEVWVVNKQANYTSSRDIVGVTDLGEGYGPDGAVNFQASSSTITPSSQYNQPTNNSLNRLYDMLASQATTRSLSTVAASFSSASNGSYTFTEGKDYITLESARPLSSNEYTVNKKLGYISLNSQLRNDEILAVAFVYTYKGVNYKVGELSSSYDEPKSLIVKLLKGTTQTPKYANWDLMMKNIYSIGAYQVSSSNFILDVLYNNDETGGYTNYLTGQESDFASGINTVYQTPLLKVLELDNLDSRQEASPDGRFDFVEGTTIYASKGRIIFPVVEPFGSYLEKRILGDGIAETAYSRTAKTYVYNELYDSTQTKALQVAEKNKFIIKGTYESSSSSQIQLNAMNVPEGSVVVTAGGRQLTEGTDYTVDYTLGRVNILNQGLLESGTNINIKLESNSLFNTQTKTLLGTHLDYRFSDNFNVGGTILRLNERPLTSKVSLGDEPISNTIWGLNTSYRAESQLLTTLVDKLPFLETKEVSSYSLDAEFAQLIPGQSKMLGDEGTAYIDDFESAETEIELKTFSSWSLSSPPKDPSGLFYYSNQDGIKSGYGRAKLAWYIIDPLFYGSSSIKPKGVDIYSHEVRQVKQKELFPNKDDDVSGYETRLSVLTLSYYPTERAPYNYDPSGANNAPLPNPEERWGGIMREIVTTDFEASNIEFIEFWLMDPYAERENNPGGDLYFHLGEISEDILRDSRKSYENGLPSDDDKSTVDSTIWGYVPQGKSLVDAFDTDEKSRTYQDIGLDGISDEEEAVFFSSFADLEDPAGDDFEYFLGANHDNLNHNITERYKNYNGLENNSPVASDNSQYTASNKSTPDVEDINDDNTLNTSETYYQYHVSLRPEDLAMGNNFIVDSRQTTVSGNETPVTWYQFRVPISKYDSKIGDIEDFKSIRFMRMVLSGFEEDVVVRFASLSLVRGDWRTYDKNLYQSSPSITQEQPDYNFEVSSVNIEENGSKTPVNYVLPPGIDRVTDPNQPQVKELNEQSLLLKVTDLPDNEGAAVYKSTDLDLRQYKYLRMFLHAEGIEGNEGMLANNEVTAIVRIGSDYQDNYYEYEIPLALTPPGSYTSSSVDKKTVWPEDNYLVLKLDDLVNLKLERNQSLGSDPFISKQNIYSKEVDKAGNSSIPNIIKVKGNPNLSNIRQIMIGIRNPGDEISGVTNDGESKSAEIWINELRLTEFNNKGGWATNGQFQAQLADLGVVSIAGAHSTPGFGSIEQTVDERQTEEINQVDFSSNLELGKFFPEKAKVSIPLYLGYSNTTINPEYYPGDPDVTLKDALSIAKTEKEKQEIKEIAQDVTEQKSINLTNVRWNKQFKKAKVFSPANLSASAAYSETKERSYSVEYNRIRKYGASLNYVYNNKPKAYTPFKKTKAFRKPAFRIIRDINLYYRPSSFTFSTSFDRDFQTMKLRNVYEGNTDMIIEPTTSKGLYWDRNYTLRWDLTRALKLNYSASNRAIIDEPDGASDWFEGYENREWKDSVKVNILHGGRNLQFNQKFGASYTLPINKIPLFNWTNLKTSYDATYSWTRGATTNVNEEAYGNTIKNSNTIKLTGNFNMKNLYNKVGYLKKLDKKYNSNNKSKKDANFKTVEFSKRTFFKKGTPKNIIHKLGTDDVTIKVTDSDGKEIICKSSVISPNKVSIETEEDYSGVNVLVTGKIEKGENPLVFLGENSIRLLLGIKNVSVSYSQTGSTKLPGYLPETKMMGFDMANYYGSPGWPFLLGWQDESFLATAHYNQWMTQNENFSDQVTYAHKRTLNYKTSFEPFKGLRVDFSGTMTHSYTTEQDYYNNPQLNYNLGRKYRGGNFSISTITIGSTFENVSSDNNWSSASYDKFKSYRNQISSRLNNIKQKQVLNYSQSITQKTEQGYNDGYGSTSSEVLMYAFKAAYMGRDPRTMKLDMFDQVPLPNWRLTFDGLSKIAFIQRFIKTVTLSHSYKSTYSITSYSTNSDYYSNEDENTDLEGLFRDSEYNFILKYDPSGLSINEQLTPLIGIDMTWLNSFTSKLEIRRTRTLALSMSNNQLTESRNKEFVIGAGYKFKDVNFKIITGGGERTISSDLNVRFDLSIRDNITILRSISETSEDQASTGARKTVIGLTADYVISPKVNVQFYIDRNVSNPYVSNYYPNSETNFGLSLKMTL